MTSPVFASEFLEDPAAFPSSPTGEVWGEDSVAIDFIGGPYQFCGLSELQAEALRQRFGDLCVEPTAGVVRTRVFRAEARFRTFDLTGWRYTLDQDPAPDHVRVAGLRYYGWIRPGNSEGVAPGESFLWVGELSAELFLPVLENFLRVVAAYRLLECGGVLLHSAAVVSKGEVSIFYGHSGAGKSTSSKMSAATGREILSDDLNGLAVDRDGRLQVVKLPFTGFFGQAAERGGPYPLAATYRLRKGPDHSVRDLSPAIAVASLFSCCPYVNLDPDRQAQLMDNLQRIVTQASCRELTFSLDGDFWCILEGPAEEG